MPKPSKRDIVKRQAFSAGMAYAIDNAEQIDRVVATAYANGYKAGFKAAEKRARSATAGQS